MAMCDFPSFLFCLGWDGVATLGWPKGYMHAKLLQSCPTLWIVTLQAPVSMEFSRQEYWIGMLLSK